MIAQGLPRRENRIRRDGLIIKAHLTRPDAIAPLSRAPMGIGLGIERQHRLTLMAGPNAIVIHPALI